MIRTIAFANALAVVGVIGSVLCVVLSLVAPDLVMGVAQTWPHMLNLELIRATTPPGPASIITGVVTFTAVAWLWGFAWAWFYNWFSARSTVQA